MKMNDAFLASMREAMHLLQTAGPMEATAAIQRTLGHHSPAGGMGEFRAPMPAQVVESLLTNQMPHSDDAERPITVDESSAPRPARAMGHFSQHTFANHAGQRSYKVYMPAGNVSAEPLPLVVMLHGCTQDADDFARGTRMNALADELGFIVTYPIQSSAANPSKCWNWFRPGDQKTGHGEPSIIAGITREVMGSHRVDRERVYVAGLSAGGAMAAVMIQSYPDLFAAAGVHSGLPAGCAHDLPSALAAMKGGNGVGPSRRGVARPAKPARPMIVFHGDADQTVCQSNGARLIEPYRQEQQRRQTERNHAGAGRAYTRETSASVGGVEAEYWLIHGAGHAWAGGHTDGTYTDPKGPNASAEMLRFFLAHPLTR
ncbi:PHB depolymerase family esterase [Cupriavidus sp. AU9028]|uniref:extracellular catalytic domain type 1 short-chain-length polyhydroxyalkanoate depolymerase n=1 Tax=Cupriavidus sp. AU9028 TaxID=2871157 RepID=UPI001C952315|nr:PHB depolymerase family esterase [Cupriavidus sp. AU9028]MBY4897120.1 PHB depolymerase family esterase [Cupriavidus sp. AU9028]